MNELAKSGCGRELSYCSNGECTVHCGEFNDFCDECKMNFEKNIESEVEDDNS